MIRSTPAEYMDWEITDMISRIHGEIERLYDLIHTTRSRNRASVAMRQFRRLHRRRSQLLHALMLAKASGHRIIRL